MGDTEPRTPKPKHEKVARDFDNLVKELVPDPAATAEDPLVGQSRDFMVGGVHGIQMFGVNFRHLRARRTVSPHDGHEVFMLELREESGRELVPVYTFADEPSSELQIHGDGKPAANLHAVEGDEAGYKDLVLFYEQIVAQVTEREFGGELVRAY